jgi:glycosyltransferase involved in cell wall biosynthesis
MPLAFASTNPSEIQTVFPTKLLEYFVSGRPILVHAPTDSWAARSARELGWGYVVDEPDPLLLAKGIDELLDAPELCARIVACAKREARARAASAVAPALWNEVRRVESSWKN